MRQVMYLSWIFEGCSYSSRSLWALRVARASQSIPHTATIRAHVLNTVVLIVPVSRQGSFIIERQSTQYHVSHALITPMRAGLAALIIGKAARQSLIMFTLINHSLSVGLRQFTSVSPFAAAAAIQLSCLRRSQILP
jgi:hypothetical protein